MKKVMNSEELRENGTERKRSEGITLIALIITIIILIILAMVSVKIITDSNIIHHAENATKTYSVEQEKELIALGYSNYKMDKLTNDSATLTVEDATVIGDETNGWTITFNKSRNQYTLQENGTPEGPAERTEDDIAMEEYVLGEDLKGQPLENIVDFESGSLKQLNGENVDLLAYAIYINNQETPYMAYYAKYRNKAYRILVDMEELKTKSVNMIYEPSGREGQKVTYSYDGTTENEKEWTILYDYGDSVEIISPEALGILILGYEDENAKGSNEFEKAVYSYNNSIDRINNYASSLVTNSNKINVRSVGSNPQNPNNRNTGKYSSEILASWNCRYEGSPVTVNGVGERGDNNSEQDFVRMSYWGVKNINARYLLASRKVIDNITSIEFDIERIGSDNAYYNDWVWTARENGIVEVRNEVYGVRPVVKINL